MFSIGSMLLGPLIGGAIGSIGSSIANTAKAIAPFAGAGLDFLGGLLTNQSNADEAARNRRFVAKMYKNRYQNTVADMRKAGLNPILAANGGSVGSAPSGSMATFDNPFHGAIGTALQTMSSLQGLENAKSQQALTDSQTGLNQSKKVAQDISNKYLDPQARALAERAQFAASLANSSSVIQESRAAMAKELAQLELANKRLSNSSRAEEVMQRRINWQSRELDYYSRPKGKEAIFWDRLDRASKAIGRGVNSALGVGKLRALSRAIR